MNRKFLAGAAASLMLTALPVVAAVPSGAAGVKPTIASAVVQHDANHWYLGSDTIAPNETVDIVVTGTGFNNGPSTAVKLTSPVFTVNSTTKNSPTQITINASLAINIGSKAIKDAKWTVTIPSGANSNGGTVKFVTHTVSNCGTSLPLANAGSTYGTTPSGAVDVAGGPTGSNANLTYFDVNILGTNPLCTADLQPVTEVPTFAPSWGINYPIDFSGSSAARLSTNKHSADWGFGHINGVGFSFPYTTATTLVVTNATITYKLVGVKQASGCQVEETSPVAPADASCSLSGTKTMTVTTNVPRTYHKGDTIESPVVKLLGIGAKSSPVQIIPVSNVSHIQLGAGSLDITFAPRARTANATYAPVSYAAAS